jgi:hypothetical protein
VLQDKSVVWAHRAKIAPVIRSFALQFEEHHRKHASAYKSNALPPLQTISVDFAAPAVVRTLLRSCYDGTPQISPASVFELFMLGSKFSVARLTALCGEFFRQRKQPSVSEMVALFIDGACLCVAMLLRVDV